MSSINKGWSPRNIYVLLLLDSNILLNQIGPEQSKKIAQSWPTVPGEAIPTATEVESQLRAIRRKVLEVGVLSSFFSEAGETAQMQIQADFTLFPAEINQDAKTVAQDRQEGNKQQAIAIQSPRMATVDYLKQPTVENLDSGNEDGDLELSSSEDDMETIVARPPNSRVLSSRNRLSTHPRRQRIVNTASENIESRDNHESENEECIEKTDRKLRNLPRPNFKRLMDPYASGSESPAENSARNAKKFRTRYRDGSGGEGTPGTTQIVAGVDKDNLLNATGEIPASQSSSSKGSSGSMVDKLMAANDMNYDVSDFFGWATLV